VLTGKSTWEQTPGLESMVPTPVEPSPVKPAAVVAVEVPVAPIRSAIVVAVSRVIPVTAIGSAVVATPVKNRYRNWQPKDKVNTCARRRFSKERQSRDDQQEDNELFHTVLDAYNTNSDQKIVSESSDTPLLSIFSLSPVFEIA
jgi:hypothetical protein